MCLGIGAATQAPAVPRPLFLANAMHTTFDYRGRPRPVMVRKRPRDWEIRAHGDVYALTARERDRLLIWLLEKEAQAA
jgi:hypothetical protein